MVKNMKLLVLNTSIFLNLCLRLFIHIFLRSGEFGKIHRSNQLMYEIHMFMRLLLIKILLILGFEHQQF